MQWVNFTTEQLSNLMYNTFVAVNHIYQLSPQEAALFKDREMAMLFKLSL